MITSQFGHIIERGVDYHSDSVRKFLFREIIFAGDEIHFHLRGDISAYDQDDLKVGKIISLNKSDEHKLSEHRYTIKWILYEIPINIENNNFGIRLVTTFGKNKENSIDVKIMTTFIAFLEHLKEFDIIGNTVLTLEAYNKAITV